jgi:hypothetical protein
MEARADPLGQAIEQRDGEGAPFDDGLVRDRERRPGQRGVAQDQDAEIEEEPPVGLCHGNPAGAQRALRYVRTSRRRRCVPPRHGRRAEDPERASGDQVALDVEGVVGAGVRGEEALTPAWLA